MEVDFSGVGRGFSKQSAKFDEEDQSNPILQWMRGRVWAHAERYLKPGNKILELNAGTGIDAVHFANKGFKVHATDLSDGMVEQISKKITGNQLRSNLSVQQLSYTQLRDVENGPYDYVFSDFGGLNCISDLTIVSRQLPALIKKGAYVTLVIMPAVCPWEIATALKGNFKHAFRRFKKEGTLANLEGEKFMTWYFSPAQVLDAFGKEFQLAELEGLASFCPPPHKKHFAIRCPLIWSSLTGLDEKLCHTFPFNQWADHFIITLRYLP